MNSNYLNLLIKHRKRGGKIQHGLCEQLCFYFYFFLSCAKVSMVGNNLVGACLCPHQN